MATYKVNVDAVATVPLGTFTADTEEEAIEKALEKIGTDTIALCWSCAAKVGNLVIDEDTVSAEITKE